MRQYKLGLEMARLSHNEIQNVTFSRLIFLGCHFKN